MKERQYIKDKSYGMIGAARVSGSSRELFMSDVQVSEFIQITIKTAELSRDLNRDWVHGDDTLIQVRLSPLQWAEMLTCLNVSDGVPCTIHFTRQDGLIEYKPLKPKMEILEEEVEERVDEGLEKVREALDEITSLMKANKVGKAAGEAIRDKLSRALYILGDGSFYRDSAKEEISRMVAQAKSEVSAFVDHKIYSTGLESIKSGLQIPQLPEKPEE